MARFTVSDPLISECFGTKYVVILSDFNWWMEHYEELLAWCQDTGCQVQGVTVDVPSDQLMTLFSLRWS